MKKHMFVAGAAVLALGFTATIASAACNVEHPKKAGQLSSNLVQAFVSCGNPGGNTPNSTTEGGVPTCAPPQTFHEQSGSPAGGWLWDEAKGQGKVQFKAAKNKVVSPLNPVPNTADLAVQASMSGVLDENGPAGPSSGTLATVARATLEDRGGVCAGGPNAGAACSTNSQCPGSFCDGTPMTVVDFPAGFALPMSGGKAKIKTSANVLLNGIGQPGLPGCSTIEVVSVTVTDPNGDTFANIGTFLPDLPQ